MPSKKMEAKLEALWDSIRTDPQMSLMRGPGQRLVPGRGSHAPLLFIVGGPPGATDVLRNRAMSGRAGTMLERLIKDVAGIPLARCWFTHCLKYRPDHMGVARAGVKWLDKEWRILNRPPVKVTIGAHAWTMFSPPDSGTLRDRAAVPIRTSASTTFGMHDPSLGITNVAARDRIEEHWDFLGRWVREQGLT